MMKSEGDGLARRGAGMEPPAKRARPAPLVDRLDAGFADTFRNAAPYLGLLIWDTND